jgi:hypothetical protein
VRRAIFSAPRPAMYLVAARPDATEYATMARVAWEDERVFATFIQTLGNRLKTLYAEQDAPTALMQRDVIFTDAQAQFPALPLQGKRFEKFDEVKLNNAVLLQSLLYTTDLDVFEAIAARLGGVRPALDFIEAAAKSEPSDPFGAVRRAFAALG